MPVVNELDGTISHLGRVLDKTRESSFRETDYYAIVWNDDAHEPDRVRYNTTAFAGSHLAEIDADDDVRTYFEWHKHMTRIRTVAYSAVEDAREVVRGKRVETPDGPGDVFWIGASKFPPYSDRVGVKLDDGGKGFFDASKVTVAESYVDEMLDRRVEEYGPDAEILRAEIDHYRETGEILP